MWAVCDVSVVQPHLYFGLFGLGAPMYATLKIACPISSAASPVFCFIWLGA